ncbi:haloacid dehalogenase [Paenibacillus solani]|uniref:haloacid dehalogenase n=1 Tax=Paenibacillus solani TaxID=1705565 RepID=UPI003D28C97C
MKNIQLVLDVAGVLITNFSPGFWDETARVSEITYEELKRLFAAEIRKPLWTGQIGEEDFWLWLARYCPIEPLELKKQLFNNLKTMRAFDLIPKWSEQADIHLLSNHRSEWLEVLLAPIQPYLTSVTISSEAGRCKPDLQFYHIIASKLASGSNIIYVDDQMRNLAPAESLSWTPVLADSDGKWIRFIEEKLEAWNATIS